MLMLVIVKWLGATGVGLVSLDQSLHLSGVQRKHLGDRLVLVLVKVVDLGEASGLVSSVVNVHQKSAWSFWDNLVRLAFEERHEFFLFCLRVVGCLAPERTFLALDHV